MVEKLRSPDAVNLGSTASILSQWRTQGGVLGFKPPHPK
jgi:hypothetical protein